MFPTPATERRRKLRWARKNGAEREAAHRRRACFRIGQAWGHPKPICHICGCPHIEALTMGHPDRNGAAHRKHIREARKAGRRRTPRKAKTLYQPNAGGYNFVHWIMKATLEEIREWNVRLECTYCNFYESKNGHYPEPDKRPQWPLVMSTKEAREISELLKGVK